MYCTPVLQKPVHTLSGLFEGPGQIGIPFWTR
jgi:hypothetical protein